MRLSESKLKGSVYISFGSTLAICLNSRLADVFRIGPVQVNTSNLPSHAPVLSKIVRTVA